MIGAPNLIAAICASALLIAVIPPIFLSAIHATLMRIARALEERNRNG